MRLTATIKSGICESLIWAFGEVDFCIRVPRIPATAELRSALLREKAPMATYYRAGGTPVADQWRLSRRTHAGAWEGGRRG